MNNELKFFLMQGATSVKELARLTGKSTSTLYKALKEEGVEKTDAGLFFMLPDAEASQDATGATKDAAVGPAPTEVPVAAPRGRKATADGQTLTATVTDNPRRKTSHGYRSLQIILDNPGLTTEDYLSKGGRLNDLRWDIAHGRVKAG